MALMRWLREQVSRSRSISTTIQAGQADGLSTSEVTKRALDKHSPELDEAEKARIAETAERLDNRLGQH